MFFKDANIFSLHHKSDEVYMKNVSLVNVIFYNSFFLIDEANFIGSGE